MLDRRLNRSSGAPVAVALSGGSDSLALLRLAADWAAGAGRRVVAITVDHRLNPQSGAWTRAAATAAARVGAEFRTLAWTGDKPATGLPAAARAARHRLVAQAARDAGARVVLLGHTRDDILETALMRQAGSTLGGLVEWSPSPVWPEGRGLFHLRPLLGARRAALRQGLAQAGWDWIEDPANDDPRYARARARRALAEAPGEGPGPPPDPLWRDADLATLADSCAPQDWGGFSVDRSGLLTAPAGVAARFLSALLVCASGQEQLPRPHRTIALLERLRPGGRVTAGLAGARIDGRDPILVMRESGERSRGGLQPITLPAGDAQVWDGRFALTARQAGFGVRALAGVAARLDAAQRVRLKAIPPAARGALPAVIDLKGRVSCPLLAGDDDVQCLVLAGDRLRAACGLITREG